MKYLIIALLIIVVIFTPTPYNLIAWYTLFGWLIWILIRIIIKE